MIIGLGLGFRGRPAAADTPAVVAGSADVAALPLANAVFDSGAARGSNAADIPLTGTTDAADGAQIEARIVRADTGAQIHPWAVVATAAGGAWAGAFPAAQRSEHRLKAEVRVQGSAAPVGTMPGDFMVGHVIIMIGQSEDARMFSSSYNRSGEPTGFNSHQIIPDFANENARDSFFILTGGDNGEGEAEEGSYSAPILGINETSSFTASVANMANIWTRNAPGEKVLFINATQSGSTPLDLADEEDLDRDWDDSFANGVARVRSYGSDVGVMMSTWTAAPSANGDGYRKQHYPLWTGMFAPDDAGRGGDVYTVGSDMGGGRNYDHLFWDLSGLNRPEAIFDAAVTRNAFYGPHRFEDRPSGSLLAQKQDTRLSIRNWADDPEVAAIMRPKGPEIIAYQNGNALDASGGKVPVSDPGAVGWEAAPTHPAEISDDGLTARARHTAVAAMYALGVGPAAAVNHHVPRFNRADWQTTHVDLWYEAPDGSTPAITTTRLARGEPAIDDSYPHRTEVAGFYINGQPAQRAEIVSGRVRVFPDGIAAAFDYTHSVQYGVGGASAIVLFFEDELAEIWKNQPICPMGFTGYKMDGIAMEPMPLPEDIANTLPAPASGTFSVAAGEGPSFVSPNNLEAGVSAMTFRLRLTPISVSGSSTSLFQQLVRMSYQVLSDGSTRFTISDSTTAPLNGGGAVGLSGVLTMGSFVEILVSMSLPDRKFKVWHDGVLVDDVDLAVSSTGVFDNSRRLAMSTKSGLNATVESLEFWKAYAPDGNFVALGEPDKRIIGNGAGSPVQLPVTPVWT